MSAGKVGVRLPSLRKGSSNSGGGGLGAEDRGKDNPLRDKDTNSIYNTGSDAGGGGSGGEGNNGNGGSSCRDNLMTGRSSLKDSNPGGGGGSSRGGRMLEEIPVYIGGSNIVLPTSNTTNSRKVTNGNGLQYRRCCFFWTCCCRCSCLNVKHHNQDHLSKDGRINPLNGDNEPIPSIEEIRAWGESFDRLMKCSGKRSLETTYVFKGEPYGVGRKAFREFLKCEYSEENILFWQACEDLKREHNPAMVEEKARLIYEDFISILSPKEVSLDSRVREIINRNMVDPTTHTFDEAQTQIYTLMHRDSYPRFINSPHYKRLAQLNNNGSGGAGGVAPGGGGGSGSNKKESAS